MPLITENNSSQVSGQEKEKMPYYTLDQVYEKCKQRIPNCFYLPLSTLIVFCERISHQTPSIRNLHSLNYSRTQQTVLKHYMLLMVLAIMKFLNSTRVFSFPQKGIRYWIALDCILLKFTCSTHKPFSVKSIAY